MARGIGAAPRRLVRVEVVPRRLLRVSFVQALHTSSKTNKRSSPAGVKQNKRSRVCHRKIQNSSNYRLDMMPIFVNYPGAADIKMQPKSPEFLLDMRYFFNFSIVSLGTGPRSRRCAERTRQGEGRWSRPPKPALERSYLAENSSSANRILRPRRKKTPDRILETKISILYICILVCTRVLRCPLVFLFSSLTVLSRSSSRVMFFFLSQTTPPVHFDQNGPSPARTQHRTEQSALHK